MLRLLALALALGPALSGQACAQAPEVQFQGELPFTGAELQAALTLRFRSAEAPVGPAVTVRGEAGAVVLEQGERRATLVLGAERGPEAARLVALALLDLALADSPAVVQTAPQPAKTAPPVGKRRAAHVRARPAGEPSWTRIALGPGIGKGLGALEPWTSTISLGLSQGLPPWFLEADIEWWAAPPVEHHGFSASWHAARVRAQAGVRLRWVELLAGPAIAPLWVSGGDGYRGVLFAIGASVRAALPIGRSLEGLFALGVDVFPHRVELQAQAVSVIATPHVAPFVSIGVGWRSS